MAKRKTADNVSSSERLAWHIYKKHSGDPQKSSKPEKKSAQKKEPHVDDQQKVEGNIVKGRFYYGDNNKTSISSMYYSLNGWHYLGHSGCPGDRKIYGDPEIEAYRFYDSDFKPNFFQAFPRKKVDIIAIEKNIPQTTDFDALKYLMRAKYAYGKSSTVGASLPYTWQAHHILPMNCFIDVFSTKDIAIIRRSTYDINSGENIIFLPEYSDDTKYHNLPFHSSNHGKYNRKIGQSFKELKRTINKKRKNKEPHDSIAINIETELHRLEKENFKYIKNYGQKQLA